MQVVLYSVMLHCLDTNAPARGRISETCRPPSLPRNFFFIFFSSTDGRDSFYNISQFISSEPDPFHFSLFSLNIILLLTAWQNDTETHTLERIKKSKAL